MYGPEADLNAYATFIWPRCPTAALHGRREATVAGYVMPGGHEAHPETSGQPQTGDYGQRETRYTMNTHTPRRDPHENYEHEYRAIVQTSLDGFLRTDTSGRILEVNQAYCQMTDYSEPELLGKSISDIEFLETPAETARRIQEIIATGACRFESRHRRKDGSPVDVEVSVTYRPDPDGQILSFTRDITERKTREAVTAARMRLQQYALNHPLHDLLRATLDEAEQLTNSCIGFYHFVEADQETLTLQQWSSNTVKNMCTAEGAGAHYPHLCRRRVVRLCQPAPFRHSQRLHVLTPPQGGCRQVTRLFSANLLFPSFAVTKSSPYWASATSLPITPQWMCRPSNRSPTSLGTLPKSNSRRNAIKRPRTGLVT